MLSGSHIHELNQGRSDGDIPSTRNTLDCDQSNYSSRIVFSHIPIECGHTGNSAIRSADPENPTVESNMKWIGRPLAEIWPFEIFQMWGRWSSVAGRSVGTRSVLNILLTLISYTPLRYVRNVSREEYKSVQVNFLWGIEMTPERLLNMSIEVLYLP